MPGVDWIPGVSHLKATLQAVTGDTEGAKKTLTNFHRECPVVSQITSLAQLAAGDTEGALETQKICLGTVNNVANAIPIVGHGKGVIHHIVGDHEGGNKALNAATRSTVVVGSGAVAAIATGGIGAIPAGITAGISYDAAASVITDEDQGCIAAVKNAIDNPSAGSIFDAVAIPVGDGFAGYSGGQIVKKVTINRLESARTVKLQELDAVYDGKGNSGAALKLGDEINSLTSEINVMKHGTRKYWVDAKSGEVNINASSSNVAGSVPMTGYADDDINQREKVLEEDVPMTGYVDDDINQKEKVLREYFFTRVFEDSLPEQEDALYYDSYVKAITTEKNIEENRERLRQLAEQSLQGSIHDAYKNVNFTTLKILSDLLERIKDLNRDPNRNPNNMKKDLSQLITWSWLRLIMPEQFSYTVVVRLNSTRQGLYHSFIRHIDEWQEVISIDETLSERLKPLITEIERLASAKNITDAEQARNQFEEAGRQLSRERSNDFQIAMVEIQMLMYRFIQENITIDNFLGRDITDRGSERLLFKVKTKDGNDKVMVICVSNELFEPERGDNRPIRLGITVFFNSWEEFKRQRITETKEEMLKKRKNAKEKK